jgi:DNA-binding MarR family transcriptional regulator
LLDGLERDGYLERRHTSQDRRALTIRLTDKARLFFDAFLKAGAMPISQNLPLDDDELQTLKELLGRIDQAIQRSGRTL